MRRYGAIENDSLYEGQMAEEARGRRGQDSMLLGHDSRERRIEANRARLQAYEGLCEKVGELPADVAPAWLLAQPAVTTPMTS